MSRLLIPLLVVALVALAGVSLLAGTVWLSPADVLAGLTSGRETLAPLIVTDIRLPRTLLALLFAARAGPAKTRCRRARGHAAAAPLGLARRAARRRVGCDP